MTDPEVGALTFILRLQMRKHLEVDFGCGEKPAPHSAGNLAIWPAWGFAAQNICRKKLKR